MTQPTEPSNERLSPEELANIERHWTPALIGLSGVGDLTIIHPDGSEELAPPLNPDGTPDYETRDAMLKLLAETPPPGGEEDAEAPPS